MSEPNEIAIRHEVDDLPLWRDAATYQMLEEVLNHYQISEEVFAQLVAAYRSHAHKQRTRGLTADFDGILLSAEEDR